MNSVPARPRIGSVITSRIRISLFLVLLVLVSFSPVISKLDGADSSAILKSQIEAEPDKARRATLYKELGEQYVSQDNYSEAAMAFSKALQSDRTGFSARERTEMGVYMSWGDRLRDAIRELRLVVQEDPANVEARSHLARTLSWHGELTEAVGEADKVLQRSPDNRAALLIKADALRWKDRIHEAIAIYQRLIAKDRDFSAQVGLAHSRLAIGNRVGAIVLAQSLKPEGLVQEREYERILEAIVKEAQPRVDARFLYYRDSDTNQVYRYSLSHSFWINDWSFDASLRHTDANRNNENNDDKGRANRAEDLMLKGYRNITDDLGLGFGLGLNQLADKRTSTFPLGQFRANLRLLHGSVGVAASREVLTDTAELIRNQIRVTNGGLHLSQALTDRLTVRGGYTYRHFSDTNRAHDGHINSEYAILLDPKVAFGHRFRFLDFRGQTGSGFFDPDDYFANRGFVSYYLRRPNYYIYGDVYLGHQSFKRDGISTSDLVKGGAASFGFTPTTHLVLELYAEGGNFAAASGSGFTYFTLGPRLIYRF